MENFNECTNTGNYAESCDFEWLHSAYYGIIYKITLQMQQSTAALHYKCMYVYVISFCCCHYYFHCYRKWIVSSGISNISAKNAYVCMHSILLGVVCSIRYGAFAANEINMIQNNWK